MDPYKEWLGIPDGPRPPDHYTLLRVVQFEDNTEKIRNNYKKLNAHVRKYATGQFSVLSQQVLNELAKAMLCLTDPERKREYDESQGREFPEDETGTIPMERVLVKQGHIDRDQAKEVQEFADLRGLSMRDAVVQMKLVSEETATQALAAELKLPFVDLEDMVPAFRVLQKVPQKVCQRNGILPLFVDDNMVLVACSDDPTPELEEELRLRYGLPMRRVLATPSGIRAGIDQYFAEMEAALAELEAADENLAARSSSTGKTSKAEAKSKPAKKTAGTQRQFSDLSPEEQHSRKQLGMIMMMWGFIGSVLFDQFVLKAFVPALQFSGALGFLPSLTTLIVAPSVIIYVTKFYWK
ncbi:general secretion pathway protein GspE [bacterium]|nr:general secretion pathway protein GspE [bacterium]